MAATINADQKLEFQKVIFRYSVRFEYVLFPFDMVELVEHLARSGYTPTIGPRPRMFGQNVRFLAKGKIAQKGDTEVEINDELGVLATISSSPASALQCLNEIIQLIKDKFCVDLTKNAAFYELMENVDIKTSRNAIEAIEHTGEKNSCMEAIGKILGQEISNYTIRLVPKGQVPSQKEWLDITIEPDTIRPNASYRVLAIYRSEDKSKVETFAQSLVENLTQAIRAIEA